MNDTVDSALLFALLPVIAVIGLMLNLFIRARGGRSFIMRLKGFGIELTVESADQHQTPQPRRQETDEKPQL